MLRFNDTAQRELRSDTSLLRGDRDKPGASCYLEQCPHAKPTAHTVGLRQRSRNGHNLTRGQGGTERALQQLSVHPPLPQHAQAMALPGTHQVPSRSPISPVTSAVLPHQWKEKKNNNTKTPLST